MSDEHTPAVTLSTVLYCPYGCGRTIVAKSSGAVECTNPDCPDPRSIEKIMEQSSTRHIVRVEEWAWSAVHPITERIGHRLLSCDIEEGAAAVRSANEDEGDFLVWKEADEWKWSRIANDPS